MAYEAEPLNELAAVTAARGGRDSAVLFPSSTTTEEKREDGAVLAPDNEEFIDDLDDVSEA